MTRTAIASPRTTVPSPRRIVLPSWLRGRASLYFDPTDDRLTGTIPADLTVDSPFTILARLYPLTMHTATNRGAVSFGQVGADTGAFLGQVIAGGRAYIGGGLIGTTLADSRQAEIGAWSDCMIRYAGGAAGALTLVVNGRSTAGVATANITGVVAELGRLLAAGTCFGGNVSDPQILSRAISDAEYDAWRYGTAIPATTRRRWTCENPGYGATCHEEIGGTEDVITGALWSPIVPFRRRRIVEDVAACFAPNNASRIVVPHVAALDPGAGEFGIMGWVWRPGVSAAQECIAAKSAGWIPPAGWLLLEYAGTRNTLFKIGDGVGADQLVTASSLLPDGGWYHMAATRQAGASGLRLYINAGRPSTSASTDRNCSNAANIEIGDMSAAGIIHHGRTSDFCYRVGSVFTWDEIEAHYYDGITPTAPAGSVQIGWGMREGAGVTVASIPAGYPGTLSAASWTTATRSKKRASS